MGKFKKRFILFIIIAVSILLVKGNAYRILFNYESIGIREQYSLNDNKLIHDINKELEGRSLNINQAIKLALEKTNDCLEFSSIQISNNPNELINSKKANCIGYSTLFNSILSHIITTQENLSEYQSTHQIGKIRFLGFNIHSLFNNNFFKDHDYNEIVNMKTLKKICVDPSLNDYLGIETVTRR